MKRTLLLSVAVVILTAMTPALVFAADTPLLTAGTGGRVLILSTTISPAGPTAWEAQAAAGLGFVVDIATPAAWNAISSATLANATPTGAGSGFLRFGQYWALILGDPNCTGGVTPLATADSTKAVWSPVIRNGNIIINGEDFSFHAFSQVGSRVFITNGVRFATSCPTNTGLFASLSCYYTFVGNTVTPVSAFSQISLAGGFSVVGGSHEKAHLVAAHPALSGLTDAVLSNYGNSSHNLFIVRPSDFTVLAMMMDANPVNNIYTAGDGTIGAPYILAKGKGLVPVGSRCLSVNNRSVDCTATNMTYKWDFCVTNTGSDLIKYLTILDLPAGVTVSQDIVALPSVLTPGQGTCLTLYVTNAPGLTNMCFTMGAHTTNFFACCSVTNCLKFEPCCVYLSGEKVTPVAGAGCYDYTFTVKNVTSIPIKYLILVQDPAPPPACLTFSPDIVVLAPLAPGASVVKTVRVCIAAGCTGPFSFLASAHDTNLAHCCSTRHTVPPASVIKFPSGFDGSVFEVGSTIRVPVAIDSSVVQPRSARGYLGTNGLDGEFVLVGSIVDPPDGVRDDWFVISDAVAGTYVLQAEETDVLGGIWSSEPATVYVVDHQHVDPAGAGLFIPAAQLAEGQLTIIVQPAPGEICHVEYTDSLSPARWQLFRTIVGDGTAVTVTDSVSSARQRFFRVRMP